MGRGRQFKYPGIYAPNLRQNLQPVPCRLKSFPIEVRTAPKKARLHSQCESGLLLYSKDGYTSFSAWMTWLIRACSC